MTPAFRRPPLLPLLCLALAAPALLGCDPSPTMRVSTPVLATGADVVVTFDEALEGRATNQYWVALQPADAPPSSTAGRIVLERTDRLVRLRTTAPGDFEVRLHGAYPKAEHHLLARIKVKVEGWPVKTGIEPRVSADECLDRWLAEQKLDAHGWPEGTADSGRGPPPAEAAGATLSRWQYIAARHPGLARTCDPGGGPAR